MSMNKAQQLAAGLALIGEFTTSASFYNSTGGDAIFALSRTLTGAEQVILQGLGFVEYYESPVETRISFGEWRT